MKRIKIYLVEDCGNSPGRIYAIFRSHAAAMEFACQLEDEDDTIRADVVERTLLNVKAPILGFNE